MLGLPLKQFRKDKKVTQKELAIHLGVTQQTIAGWENGRSTPDPAALMRLAEFFDISVDTLLGRSHMGGMAIEPYLSTMDTLIPVVGSVRAGYGALAFEEDLGAEPANVRDPENYFYLVVKGDSMEPRIQDGDLALVHRQPALDDGDLGVVVYGDEGEGTLKRFRRVGNAIMLQPFNPSYESIVIKGEELNRLYIAGKVVETKARW